MTTKTKRTFTAEFKAEAVKLITVQGYTIEQAAHSLGVSKQCARSLETNDGRRK